MGRTDTMNVIHRRAAGPDVHKRQSTATVHLARALHRAPRTQLIPTSTNDMYRKAFIGRFPGGATVEGVVVGRLTVPIDDVRPIRETASIRSSLSPKHGRMATFH